MGNCRQNPLLDKNKAEIVTILTQTDICATDHSMLEEVEKTLLFVY